jgi:hypothetical protein
VNARFLVALIFLFIGALAGTLAAIIATNGYGTAGGDENVVVAGYLILSAGCILLLAWLSARFADRLSRRVGWGSWVTLPLILLPALVIEIVALPVLAVILAELSRSL